MTEDRFENWIREAASAYNEPPVDVPRQEMWARVRAAREYNRPSGAVPRDLMWQRISSARAQVAGATATRVVHLPNRTRRWIRNGAAIAATLLLGIAIGRSVDRDTAGMQPQAVASTGTERPDAVDALTGDAGTTGSVATTSADVSSQPNAATDQRVADTGDREFVAPRTTRVVTTAVVDAGTSESPGRPGSPSTSITPYTVATERHLNRAEALLVSFGSAPRDEEIDALMLGWARDLLLGTRLLLDSPAADDPARRKFLDDLELVLVQLVQLSQDPADSESRVHVDEALEQGKKLMRMRDAISARGSASDS